MKFSTYNVEDNSELRKLQMTVLKNMKVFANICEKNNLRYFMVGGTMLGAIRHKGFIPWDDDADMGMPREDYEKFIEIAEDNLPEGYSFLNYRKSQGYHRYFSRIVDNNTRVYNASNSKEIIENIWVDIFPFDGMPRNKIIRGIHFGRCMFWRLIYHASCFEELVNLNRPGRPFYQKVVIKFLKITKFGQKLDECKILDIMDKRIKKYPFEGSQFVFDVIGAYVSREIIPSSMIGNTKLYTFEDTEFAGPELYDEFLTHYYGNYMTPPADAGKDKHDIRKIEYLDEVGSANQET